LEKKQEYGDRVGDVECDPLVFSTFGELGREANTVYSIAA